MRNEATLNNLNSVKLTDDQKLCFRIWLQNKFTDRCKRNPKYSLRAFALSLNVNPSSLSQILSGKRIISKKIMNNFCKLLLAGPKELKIFGLIENKGVVENYMQINLDTFSVISDWYHYAILELTYVSGFKSDAKWISNKLGITVDESRAAIDRLKRLGLLLCEESSFVKSVKLFTNQSTISTSAAHREFQKQILEKAMLAIDECSQEEKDITSITMAIDESLLDEARKKIKRFRREMSCFLEDGEQSRVFNLAIQLYPISRKSN